MTVPTNQLLIVTGDPRSGTSLLMQTLKLLGVPVAGEEFPGDARRDEQSQERARELNPKGFYEIPGHVMRGFPDAQTAREKAGGKAVKIISPGVPRTPVEVVYRYILCLRDPTSVAQSQTHLDGPVKVPGIGGWENPTRQPSATRYMLENGGLASWLAQQPPAVRDKFLMVDYDAFVAAPLATIDRIAAHAGATADTTAAAANVDPSLSRSPAAFQGWPQDQQIDGGIAESLYAALLAWDFDALELLESQIDTRRDFYRRENARWYDPATGLHASHKLHAKLDSDAQYRSRWLNGFTTPQGKRIRGLRDEILHGLHPMASPDFEAAAGEQYEIARPADLGDLRRNLVRYRGEAMTYEAAFTLHQRLWANGQAKLLPLAERQRIAREVR